MAMPEGTKQSQVTNAAPEKLKLPIVECPGCRRPMTVRLIEPSPALALSTVHFRLLCKAETKRNLKLAKAT